ncbi:LOW QUALITY PROTEIN: transmembrane protein 160-like [Salarias fasciatus]|uniref:LOW QUALITY PROTEIN: transmembrane protein 160-like n=1 Tax=Salarias fasciatus TaxID=181472 RepID=UPI001176D269|nr:LOW QUALITY PROTEIN: transmembrane protein 160-like [Salarias fasciatus]
MAFLTLFLRRQLPPAALANLARAVKLLRPPGAGPPLRRLHDSARQRGAERGPWERTRAPEQQQQQYQFSDLDKADALMLRKSHETGFLSWFRNGLLATGIGVIAFVQSEVGREAGYAFFLLGGVCVSFGGASYIGSLLALRRMMMLSVPALLLQGAAVGSVALFWLCAVSLYIGRLEVEIIHEDEEGAGEDEDECRECRERREHRGYRAGPDGEDSDSGGQNK